MAQPTQNTIEIYDASTNSVVQSQRVKKTPEEWKRTLTALQYNVARRKGTESPFSGGYVNNHCKGIYKCACCGLDLFSSEDKFDSGSGWPSFAKPVNKLNIAYSKDSGLSMNRIEVLCLRCDAHLGHIFDDGPAPTGNRYCVNSAALKFVQQK